MAGHPTECEYVPLNQYDWSTVPFAATSDGLCLLPWNPVVYCLIAAFHAVAVSTGLEINLQLFSTFRRWSTLYFWSLFVTAWGVILLTTAFDIALFAPGTAGPGRQTLNWIAWVASVTGFSMILYSRLHLIAYNRTLLRAILIIILVNGFLFHTPVIVAGYFNGPFGANFYSHASRLEIYFCVQELFLSTLYIFLFWRFFRENSSERQVRVTFYLLIAAQLIIVLADVATTTLLYMELFVPRLMVLTFASALKLRIEFLVLNRLAKIARRESIADNNLSNPNNTPGAAASTSEISTIPLTGDLSYNSIKTIRKQEEVSIWNVNGPACPECMRYAGSSERVAGKENLNLIKDSMEDLERQYLGRFKGESVG